MLIWFLIFSVSLALDAGFENEVNEEMAEMGVNSKVSTRSFHFLAINGEMRTEVISCCPSVILLCPIESFC
jgi:hypothetical protein